MATAGVFDIELNEDGADDSDHSDEEPIKPASEEHVQVMIVTSVIDVISVLFNWDTLWSLLICHCDKIVDFCVIQNCNMNGYNLLSYDVIFTDDHSIGPFQKHLSSVSNNRWSSVISQNRSSYVM